MKNNNTNMRSPEDFARLAEQFSTLPDEDRQAVINYMTSLLDENVSEPTKAWWKEMIQVFTQIDTEAAAK